MTDEGQLSPGQCPVCKAPVIVKTVEEGVEYYLPLPDTADTKPGRVYEAGRSTAGWKKGARVRSLSQLPDGTLFIQVSHSFKAENLAIVTEQRPLLPGVWASWAHPDGMRYGTRDVFAIHEFMLDPKHDDSEERFLAVPAGTEDTADFILVIEMRYDDYEVHGSQQTPAYHRELAFATLEEAKVALDRVQDLVRTS